MRRRRNRDWRQGKQMLGEHRTIVRGNVERLFKNEAAMVLRPSFNAEQVVDMLVSPEHKAILRSAHGVVNYFTSAVIVQVEKNVHLRIDFNELGYAPPYTIHGKVTGAVADLCATAAALRRKWVNVLALAYWFDAEGTPGAVRNLWPTLKVLAPEHEGLQEANVGTYYVDPPGYSKWLPLMRETATTVASALMLPPAPSVADTAINLHFPTVMHSVNDTTAEWGGFIIPLC